MNLIKLNIVGYSHSEFQQGAFALILSEEKGKRNLSIVIGACEAQSIAIGLENIKVPRPLTHDLIKDIATKYNINLSYVYIHQIIDGIFHSYLFLKNQNGDEEKVDARTSDAVAIAIRFNVPIYTNENILKEANLDSIKKHSNSKKKKEKEKIDNYSNFSTNELKNKLKKLLLLENYEEAVKIRDEIKKRKK